MIVKHYSIEQFSTPLEERLAINAVVIPAESIFLKVKVLPDGIYAFYEVPPDPTIIGGEMPVRTDRFQTVRPQAEIVKNAIFVDILDIAFEKPDGETGTMIIPIYRLSNGEAVVKGMVPSQN